MCSCITSTRLCLRVYSSRCRWRCINSEQGSRMTCAVRAVRQPAPAVEGATTNTGSTGKFMSPMAALQVPLSSRGQNFGVAAGGCGCECGCGWSGWDWQRSTLLVSNVEKPLLHRFVDAWRRAFVHWLGSRPRPGYFFRRQCILSAGPAGLWLFCLRRPVWVA